jgi:hypothetical protein
MEGYQGLPAYYSQTSDPTTPNLGLALKAMDPIVAENFVIIDTAYGSGSSIEVNGVVVPAPANFINSASVTLSVLGSNISLTSAGGGTPGGSSGDIQYNNSGVFGGSNVLLWNPSTGPFTLTSANNTDGTNTVYNGTITGGASNAFAGLYFLITGFTNVADDGVIFSNGTFLCVASTATTLTLNNADGVAETHAATALGMYSAEPALVVGDISSLSTTSPFNGWTQYDGRIITADYFASPTPQSNFYGIIQQLQVNEAVVGPFTLTSANNTDGTNTVYNGTITGGASNAFAGKIFNVTGFVTNPSNNGEYYCVASTATTLTLDNSSGIAETHAATATNYSTQGFWGGIYASVLT